MSEDNSDSFSSFMQEQVSDSPKTNFDDSNKTSAQNALDKMKQDEENEKKKEVDEAKKEAKANSQKYAAAQASLMKAQGKQFIMFLPFIILGIVILLIIITKGGSWLQGGTQFLVGKIRGE